MEKMGFSQSMQNFEKVFEDMDVKTGELDEIMDGVGG